MQYSIHELKAEPGYTQEDVFILIMKKTGLKRDEISSFRIVRRSLDARQVPVYNLAVEFKCGKKCRPKVGERTQTRRPVVIPVVQWDHSSPVIIGAGPAGLMAALIFAEAGAAPVIFERGAQADVRAGQVDSYITEGVLDAESNVLFGEGGAGLFSDGKLTARAKDRELVALFLETLEACGAPESILIDAEPHLGSDVLLELVPTLREKIIAKGGVFHFNSKVTGFEMSDRKLTGVIVNGAVHKTEHCLLAAGHSARDVYSMLSDSGVELEEKSFAIGVRLELPQDIVDRTQYGRYVSSPHLGAASFRLTRKPERQYRACYTFCMCPGGEVMSCASSVNMLTTNGMSLSGRGKQNSNAAFVVPVNSEDYKDFAREDAKGLSGCFFQEHIEQKAFEAGGSDYSVPAVRLSDFLESKVSTSLPEYVSCNRVKLANINSILPKYVTDTLRYSIPAMLSVFRGLDFDDVIVYAAETRSSAPVRIVRNKESFMSVNTEGLYPCGEGSGYAGGIVSSAMDGMKAANRILAKNSLLD